jgi:putative ABC transport system substrate-binding protein
MRRLSRALLVVLLFGALAPLLVFGAQPGTKIPRIGYLCPYGSQKDGFVPFRDGLAELGYVAGKTINIEASACMLSGSRDDFNRIASEMVRSGVDLIVAPGRSGIEAARSATTARRIPLVFLGVDDPVAMGLVASLPRPGGHITGLSSMSAELVAKRLELLKELLPRLSRVGVLVNPASAAGAPSLLRETEAAARALRLHLERVDARVDSDLDKAVSALAQARVGSILVLPDPMFFEFRARLVASAMNSRLPMMSQERAFVDAGGLVAYGPSLAHQNRQVAHYVDRILKGAKPADLPVEQPTKFELVINLRTAKALGVTIPPSLLLRADEVIQ